MSKASRRGILLVLLGSILLGQTVIVPPASSAQNRAGIVVQHPDGTISKDCVRFSERWISGYELLDRSDLRYRAAEYSFGHAICWLDGRGCFTTSTKNCFCKPWFWGYWNQGPNQTKPSPAEAGPDDRRVRDEAVDYWVWGDGTVKPKRSFTAGQICRTS